MYGGLFRRLFVFAPFILFYYFTFMSKSFSVLVTLLFFCPMLVLGQTDKKSKLWNFELSLGASMNSGNVDNVDLKNGASLTRNDSTVAVDVSYKLVYSREDGAETNKGVKGGAKLDFLQYNRWSPFVATEAFSNRYKGYNYQVSALAGIKYRIYSKGDTCDYSLSLAFVFDRVDYTPEESQLDDRNYRLSFRPKMRQRLSDVLLLKANVFYRPSLEDFSDYVLEANGSLSVQVKKHFFVSFAVEYEYHSEVPAETYEHSDLSSELSFVLKF